MKHLNTFFPWVFVVTIAVLAYSVHNKLINIPHLTMDTVLGFAAGIIAGFFLLLAYQITQNKTVDAYKRQLEKTSIDSTENSSRVRVLEQKIEVLEKALQNALDK